MAVEDAADEGDRDARDVIVELLLVPLLDREENVAAHEHKACLGVADHLVRVWARARAWARARGKPKPKHVLAWQTTWKVMGLVLGLG